MIIVAATGSLSTALGAGEGVISGQVVNKTKGGSSVAGLGVTLTAYVKDTLISEQKATSDSAGKFEFTGLSNVASSSYSVKTSFQDADYSSDKLILTADSPSVTTELAVYDSTTSDENIQVSNGHMVVSADQGALQVMEVWRFTNTGDKTYIGAKGKTARATVKFTLPQGAGSVSPGQGFTPETTPTGIVDTATVPPGITDVDFTYVIPYNGADISILRKTDYPVANFKLLVKDSGVKVTSLSLTPQEPLDMGGTKYVYFTAQNLPRGIEMDASFSGVTRQSNTPSGASIPWPWLAAGVGALSAIVLVSYSRLRKGQAPSLSPAGDMQPVSLAQTPNEKNSLIRELARLDDDYEAGKIIETEYRARRSKAKHRLTEILAKTRARGNN